MEFTTLEMKLIERLRERERRWPRLRWILLGLSVLFAAIDGIVAGEPSIEGVRNC